jgi:hypothetical protein
LFWGELRVPAPTGSDWQSLQGRAEHEHVPGGCVGCHGGAALQQGATDHSFQVEPRVCASCHLPGALQDARNATGAVRARAQQLLRELTRRCGYAPPSAAGHFQVSVGACDAVGLRRARYELSVLLGDEAAVLHNLALSRQLLADIELRLRPADDM